MACQEGVQPALLFAYGTLGPRFDRRPHEWRRDAVRGRLFDLGVYPALVDCGLSTAAWVEGSVRAVEADELDGDLDAYEGVAEGLFERVAAVTRDGHRVWVYVYARALPQWARGPLSRWDRAARGAP
jgi:gamma-glutamylcyclotransferase (GGCT)/AIG2-like uncharacterized protein YtfP